MNDKNNGFSKLNKSLSSRFRLAYDQFNDFEGPTEDLPKKYFDFFKKFGLQINYGRTDVKKEVYSGTYFYAIKLSTTVLRNLDREEGFSQYGLSSEIKAIEKLVDKAFNLIDHLVRRKPYPQRIRRS